MEFEFAPARLNTPEFTTSMTNSAVTFTLKLVIKLYVLGHHMCRVRMRAGYRFLSQVYFRQKTQLRTHQKKCLSDTFVQALKQQILLLY